MRFGHCWHVVAPKAHRFASPAIPKIWGYISIRLHELQPSRHHQKVARLAVLDGTGWKRSSSGVPHCERQGRPQPTSPTEEQGHRQPNPPSTIGVCNFVLLPATVLVVLLTSLEILTCACSCLSREIICLLDDGDDSNSNFKQW